MSIAPQIASEYQAAVTVQDYSRRPTIAGVELLTPPFHRDDSGNFTELVRLTAGQIENLTDFTVRQVNLSVVLPGVVKAFHFHLQQEDLWYVSPHERLLVNMVDLRAESPTKGVRQRLILGGGANVLLRIPSGVAHGGANLWSQPVNLLYFMSGQFDPQQPDEQRLPWNNFGEDIWKLSRE